MCLYIFTEKFPNYIMFSKKNKMLMISNSISTTEKNNVM